jgi:hypothetical protein
MHLAQCNVHLTTILIVYHTGLTSSKVQVLQVVKLVDFKK